MCIRHAVAVGVMHFLGVGLIGAHGRKFTEGGTHGRSRLLQADEGVDVIDGIDDRSLAAHALSAAPPPLSPKPNGDEACPCLTADELAARFPPDEIESDSFKKYLGPDVELSTFGAGCHPHDVNATRCSPAWDNQCANTVPLPPDCDFSHCRRSFCYVDPAQCSLLYKPSFVFRGRYFSYATCGFMDSFTYTERLSSLRGKVFKVALNSNTGGWQGAYHPTGKHFTADQRWEGPIVNFVRTAALEGGFSLNVTSPPDFLRNESIKYFGKSSFDYCVYAAALGYVDLCVSAYTVTDKRASVTSFFETSDSAVYLITFKEEGGGATWESFKTNFLTIFEPFSLGSWLMIVFFALPVLGLLMFFHEYKAPGGCYPVTVPVALQDAKTGKVKECTAKKVPAWKNISTSVYTSFLAFFQESYDVSVVSIGGKINIIAMSSFILLVLAVYTANLAAILTTDITKTKVNNLQEAIDAGYNFCSERKNGQAVIDLHGLDPSLIVPDPPSLGGDGRPGFNCPNCGARSRVFEYMRQDHNDKSLYCNAAFASWEDLQVLHQSGDHCSKTKVGDVLAHTSTGIPLHDGDGVSESLLALFHRMKSDGKMDRELSAAEPQNQCPETAGEEGSSLNIEQLTGIWMITFSFAAAALGVRFVQRCSAKREARSMLGTRARALQRYDQWGEPTDNEVFLGGKLYDPGEVKGSFHKVESTAQLMRSRSVRPSTWGRGGREAEDDDEFEEDPR